MDTTEISGVDFLGKTKQQVNRLAKLNSITVNIIREDNHRFTIPSKYLVGRYNLEYDNGTVTAVSFG